jgi:hypothetical protein
MKKVSVTVAALVPPREGIATREKVLGALTGVVSGSTALGLHALGVGVLGMSSPLSAFVMFYMAGGVLGYTLDILFAKEKFTNHPGVMGGSPMEVVPYRDIVTRSKWLFKSLYTRHFMRFIIVALIETLTGLVVIDAVLTHMDEKGFMTDSKWVRDVGVTAVVAATIFVLFGSVLRFDWAYQEIEQPLFNVVVLMWLAVSLMTFAIGFRDPSTVRDPGGQS